MEVHSEEGEVVSLKFINNVFNLVILACIFLSVFGFVFTEQIVKMFAVGYEGEALTVAINFTRITILGIVFTGLSYVMTSYLQIKNDFVMPGLSSVPKNIIIIVATILSMKYGPYLMIWGTLVDRTLASTLPVGTIVLSKPIVRVLFERGAFDERGTYLTALALAMYSIGMVAYGLRDVLGKIFYSLQDTKTPMVNGVIAMGVNMVMDVVFIKFWGLAGLTLATSLSSIACIMLLFRSLKKKMGSFGQDKIVKATVKSLVASVIMGVVAYYSYHYMMGFTHRCGESEFVVLCVAVVLGAAVYGGLVVLFKVDEVKIVTDVIRRRFRRA